ncbi:MAG: sigma-70 family RNA polymerase sigma factor [Anaerolineales bacterium]|nr:sigma-70 family RNA polymerase sigma factor [Anaerolineales bacterium]
MDEIALIQASRQGDLDSFNRLVLAYQDQVYHQAYRMMGESASAEDAAQEAFIQAYRHLGDYRGGSFRAWLLRIVTNACYDELRRRKRRATTPLEPILDGNGEPDSLRWMADPGETPEESAQRAELSAAIQRCLDKLSYEFWAVVLLVDIHGMDYQEASQAIGKPVGTVKSRLARARLSLRGCLQGFWELLPAKFRLVEETVS